MAVIDLDDLDRADLEFRETLIDERLRRTDRIASLRVCRRTEDFERAIEASKDPHVLAWSHIYLGRMADMQEERDAALEHYRSALAAGDSNTETKAAAERGLQQPYEPQRAKKP